MTVRAPQPPCAPPRPARSHRTGTERRRGFALLITIVLMSMLVLLMVSMAALTRVETQIATNFQQARRRPTKRPHRA